MRGGGEEGREGGRVVGGRGGEERRGEGWTGEEEGRRGRG